MPRFVTPLLAALLAALPVAPARAQGGPPPGMGPGGPAGPPTGVAGRVLDDATGAPVPMATVAVYTGGAFVTGTAAGADGAFVLAPLRPATYEVRISSVGYTSATRADVAVRPGVVTPMGDVRLAQATVQLGEAEATAQRELVEQQADRTVYNVAAQPVTTGGSALETLQTLPALEVDTDGNISLRGNQNVAVHINGRPVPVTGAMLGGLLRQIPANNIERVEVIPNPSARNDASEMGGIINIVMKEGTSRGLSGGLTLGAATNPGGELSGNVSYQRGRLDVTSSYGFRYESFDLVAESDRAIGLDTLATARRTLQDFSMDHGFLSHLFNTSLDYTLRPGLNATLNGSLSYRDGNTDHFAAYRGSPLDGDVDRRWERETDGGHDGLNGDLALGLRREFAQNHTLTTEGRFTRNWDEDNDDFIDRSTDGAGALGVDLVSRNVVEHVTNEGYLQLDYVRPVRTGRVEAGGKATMRRLTNDLVYENCEGGAAIGCAGGAYVADRGLTNRFALDEGVYAAYVQAAQTFGAVEVQLGLRTEYDDRAYALTAWDPTAAANTETSADLGTHLELFPSAFLTYNVSPGTLAKASYSRRINRPRWFMLNPFHSQDDPLNIRRGDPTLRPEFTDAFELTLQYKYFLTLAPFYRRSTDALRQELLQNPETGVTTFTTVNRPTDESYGADLTLMAALPGNRLRGFLSSSVFRTVTETGSIENGSATDAIGWNVRGNVQAQLRPGTDLQLFAFYRAPFDVPGGRISGFGIATLGLSQKLMGDRATLALRVNDVLSTSRFQWRRSDAVTSFDGFRDPDIQQANLSFTYTFGQAPRRRPQPPRQDQQQGQDNGFGF
jgi:outer membrane receptor protein involved in Fe transport